MLYICITNVMKKYENCADKYYSEEAHGFQA